MNIIESPTQIKDSMEIPITACIIAQDEERYIERAIKNVKPHVSKIIIVDGGSKDKTKDIARDNGCLIYDRAFDFDFSAQRNFAASHAQTPWILWLDADEYFSQEFFYILPALVMNVPEKCSAYHVYRISIFDKEVKGTDFQWRLMLKDHTRWAGKIHEGIQFLNDTHGLKVPQQYPMIHDHSMARQLFNNKLYQNINEGNLARPKDDEGTEYHGDKWIDVKTERNK